MELGPTTIRQPPDIIDGAEENEVEVILADRYSGNRKQYLVRFVSYGPEDDLWLPLKNLTNCPQAIADYWTRQNQRKIKKT